MNLENSFEQLSIADDSSSPRRPHLVRLNAQREIACHDPAPKTTKSSRYDDTKNNKSKEEKEYKVQLDSIRVDDEEDDSDNKTLEIVFSQAQKRFPPPMSLASMGAQELEFYWQPSNSSSTRSLTSRRLQRHPTPPHLLRTLTLSSHRPHNPVAGLWRQSSLLTTDSCGSAPRFFSSRHSSTRTFASQDTL